MPQTFHIKFQLCLIRSIFTLAEKVKKLEETEPPARSFEFRICEER